MLGKGETLPPDKIGPVQRGPWAPAHGSKSRQRAGLTMVGPTYWSRLYESKKLTGWGGVVIPCIKYCTHPDIRSLLSLLIGWLTHGVLFWILMVTNNHDLGKGTGPGPMQIQTPILLSHTVTTAKEPRPSLTKPWKPPSKGGAAARSK